MKPFYRSVISLFFFLLIVLSCNRKSPTEPKNNPPKIQSISANPAKVQTNNITILSVVATDADKDELSYSWSSTFGEFPEGNNNNSVKWKAPDIAGNYICSVIVSDCKDITSDSIKVDVEKPPVISITPTLLDFSDTTNTMSFQINNIGTGTINWSASEDSSWLSIAPRSGSITTETQTVTVLVNRTGLNSGTFQAIIQVTSNGGNMELTVQMEVPLNPLISVNPQFLDFGTITATLSFNIQNSGGGILNWSATENRDWLTLDKSSGALASQEIDVITVTVARNGLGLSYYYGTISISSNGGSASISVSMETLGNPSLSVSPKSIYFGQNETNRLLTIKNNGNGILNWFVNTNQNWLTLDPLSGSTTTEIDNLLIIPQWTLLDSGNYQGDIIFTSNGGTDTVSVYLSNNPILSIRKKYLNFGVDETEMSFNIENLGSGSLNWTISTDKNWISVSENSGNTTEETDIITVQVDRRDLNAGYYTGNISINSNGGNATITVNIIIEIPELFVSTTIIDFDSTQSQLYFQIQNTGTGTLTWSLTKNQTWITLSATSESTTSETDDIIVTVDRTGLTSGNYSGKIDISSNSGTATVDIFMTVGVPVIYISTNTLDFGLLTSELQFTLINKGLSNLYWSAIEELDWLSLSQYSGTIGIEEEQKIDVTIRRFSMASGNYTGNISLSSNGGDAIIDATMGVEQKVLLDEQFNGTSLDTTKWYINDIYQSKAYLVNNGVLELGPYINGEWLPGVIDFFRDFDNLPLSDYTIATKFKFNYMRPYDILPYWGARIFAIGASSDENEEQAVVNVHWDMYLPVWLTFNPISDYYGTSDKYDITVDEWYDLKIYVTGKSIETEILQDENKLWSDIKSNNTQPNDINKVQIKYSTDALPPGCRFEIDYIRIVQP